MTQAAQPTGLTRPLSAAVRALLADIASVTDDCLMNGSDPAELLASYRESAQELLDSDAPSAEAVTFTVYGKSQTKGSTRSFVSNVTGAIVTKNDNPLAAGWANRIGIEANIAMRGKTLLDGPVVLRIRFYLQAPKRPKHAHHVTKPDLDKLLRCAKDALTGIVWRDDAQVVLLEHPGKFYAGGRFDPEGPAGKIRAELTVRPATDDDGRVL